MRFSVAVTLSDPGLLSGSQIIANTANWFSFTQTNPNPAYFTILINGDEHPATFAGPTMSPGYLSIQFDGTAYGGDTVILRYTDPSSGDESDAFQDTNGIDSPSFDLAVRNPLTSVRPTPTPTPTPTPNLPHNQSCRGKNEVGTAEADTLSGTNCSDNLKGRGNGDLLVGRRGSDRLFGDSGEDSIIGGAGNDYINGGRDSDQINGGSGADKIWGRHGHDRIKGGRGNDQLLGGIGDDTIIGGSGNNVFSGGSGNNTLIAGKDKDIFILEAGTQIVRNFDANKDKIHISRNTSYTINPGTGNSIVISLTNGASAIVSGNLLNSSLRSFEDNNIIHANPLLPT